jgi:hypothetical protein
VPNVVIGELITIDEIIVPPRIIILGTLVMIRTYHKDVPNASVGLE